MDKRVFAKSGIVLVNKPAGISSNAVVNKVKYALGATKAGHLGTLDLEGEGVLPITINKATKLFDFYLNKTKTYRTTFVFGIETDTLDLSGNVVKEKECDITKREILEVLPSMLGKYNQMPPQYSAKKINGKVAYKEARKGNVVDLKPKEVEIFKFELLGKEKKNTFSFEISCSSGTYIRCLARDLAERLDTYGSMQCILRTRCGSFELDDCITLDDVKSGKIDVVPCEELFDFEDINLDLHQTTKIYNGQKIPVKRKNGSYRVFNDQDFLGVGEVVDNILTLTLRLI